MIKLVVPQFEELSFRQELLADEETMSYNHDWGGTIDWPREKWADWYRLWVENGDGKRFYRYLAAEDGTFVGETAYHRDEEEKKFLADVIVHARFRGRGYGKSALRLLCAAAKERGVKKLYDDIASDNPAIKLFLDCGFTEEARTEEIVWLKKRL